MGVRDLHSVPHACIASAFTHSGIFPTIVLYSAFKDSAVYLFSVWAFCLLYDYPPCPCLLPAETRRSPGVADGCELPRELWESNLGPLPVLLTSESSPHPYNMSIQLIIVSHQIYTISVQENNIFLLFCFVFEARSHLVALDGLELRMVMSTQLSEC